MRQHKKGYSLVALVLFVVSSMFAQLSAFPSAEGFGSKTRGVRGGKVIAVTNLNDDGTGSFRAAVTAKGLRIVIFKVSGTIEIKTRIPILEPFLTITGQAAPGDGVTIKNHATNRFIRFC